MDSGNSGSMQSSSGGDDEYDSRADSSISAFLNSNSPPHQPPHHHQQQQQQTHSCSSSMFDPLSNFYDPLSRSAQPPPSLPFATPNSLLNLDMVWSKTLRSEPDLGGFTASWSSPTQQFLTDQSQSRVAFPSSIQIPHRLDDAPKGTAPNNDHSTTNTNTTNNNGGTNMVRNPKKRSRASRRAPTTVLTTDTANFRAMVQEFTGIPAPPFTSSPFPRTTRLDLFGTSSSSSPPPPYLLRPFAQKLQPVPPSFLSPSSSSSSPASTTCSSIADHVIASATELTNNNISSGTSAVPSNSTSSNINYQLLNNINMQLQNPVLNFQSVLLNQTPPKYNPLSNSAILGTKQHDQSLQINPSNDDSHLKMGVLEEFGSSSTTHQHHGLQNIVSSSSETAFQRRNITNGDPGANWGGDGVGSSEGDHHQRQGLFRSISGNYNNPQRVVNSNGKLNYLGASVSSSSDFHGDKGTESVTTRTSEGMVESLICSSD